MARGKSNRNKNHNSAAKIGYEAQLWHMGDTLHGSIAAEYKQLVLDLIVLRYLPEAF